MIVAGIDEAGYGPLLGPLVVGCCAFDLEDADSLESLPCLWKRLRKLVSKSRMASGRKIHVNDSKMVYSPSIGLKELERSVLAMVCACGDLPGDLNALLARTAAEVLGDLPGYSWYQPGEGEAFPIEQQGLPIEIFANALRAEMQRSRTRCVHLAAQVVLERRLNQQFNATRNKASVLFSTSAMHLDYLLKTYGSRPMTIFCDRQGGREHYGSLLRLMFEEWSLEVRQELNGFCDYRLSRNGNTVRVIFREKAEMQCMAVALASMLSKYLREAMMRRFNAFWARHRPEVVPTAGYYNDGERFLRDIEPERRKLGIADEELIRSR
jgi:Ribonuclease HII